MRSQRSNRALQKGDGLFVSLEAFDSLSWLKISNIGTARTCRVYIRMLIAYNMRAISMEDAFCRFSCAGSVFKADGILYHCGKKCARSGCFGQRLGGALILITLRGFIFDASPSFCILFFIPYLCVFHFSLFLFFLFFVFVFTTLVYYRSYAYLSNNNNNNNI